MSHLTPQPSPALSSADDLKRKRSLRVLWIILALWMIILAVGTSMYAPAPGASADKQPTVDWRRGVMVFTFVGGFLSIWMWLATRHRLPRRFRDSLSVNDDGDESVQTSQQENGQQS